MRNICISGIGTDVGKSYVCGVLCHCFSYKYFKLIQAGLPTDESLVQKIFPNIFSYGAGISLKTAASPHLGMIKENLSFNGLKIELPADNGVLVELAGGLFCPLDRENFMIDYIEKLNLPTFLVSKSYLGSINHTILSLNALKIKNIEILGVIFSADRDLDTEKYLKHRFKDINFFSLNRIDEINAISESLALKKQILKAGVKL